MGVPGFYRWAVRRVPRVRQTTNRPPYEFDNVYLDFNGVVHECVNEWSLQMREELLFELIEAHLALLLTIVRPRVLLYIALDGVAPRAKMNQQRSRRFRAARNSEADADTVEGIINTFDRNAITPGTPFMVRLGERLRAWAEANAALPVLQGVAVVISSDLDPGEGEHKIMEVIRHHPERTHCLYSNDADLVFLGLVSPAEHVYLFRSRPQARHVGGSPTVAPAAAPTVASSPCASPAVAGEEASPDAEPLPPAAVEDEEQPQPEASPAAVSAASSGQDYELLSIVAVRSWLAAQFPACKSHRLIADFVAMCCLAGNDFLPHVSAVDIYEGGLDTLLAAYHNIDPTKGHLVNEDLQLVLPRWKDLLEHLAEAEAEQLLAAAGLGTGSTKPPQKGPGPPDENWDGLSVVATWVPLRATAEDVMAGMSKQGAAVRSAHLVQATSTRRNAPVCWLVRYEDPRAAVACLVSIKRVLGQRVNVSWADPNAVRLVERPAEPFEAVSWKPALAAEVRETFEYWLGLSSLPNDSFVRRHVRASQDRFVPIKVFATFNRMRLWCQDIPEIAAMLRTSSQLEVTGEGIEAEVRGVEDFSIREDETPEQVERQKRAAAAFVVRDFMAAAAELRPEYYACHAGPAAAGAPPPDDIAATERHRARGFLSGMEWVLKYYVRGCPSWSWFYPAHYAPLCVSLFSNCSEPLDPLELATPFPPELQLLAVLPPQSAQLLPPPLRRLLADSHSPLADFYPRHFEVDLKEGDKEWQGIVLLPFVEEDRLRAELAALPWSAVSAFEPPRGFLLGEVTFRRTPSVATWFRLQDEAQAGEVAEARSHAVFSWDFAPRGRLPCGRPCEQPGPGDLAQLPPSANAAVPAANGAGSSSYGGYGGYGGYGRGRGRGRGHNGRRSGGRGRGDTTACERAAPVVAAGSAAAGKEDAEMVATAEDPPSEPSPTPSSADAGEED